MSKIREILPCPNEYCEEPDYCCICEHTGIIEVFFDEEKQIIKFRDELTKQELHELAR
jgi:hypothetical protein